MRAFTAEIAEPPELLDNLHDLSIFTLSPPSSAVRPPCDRGGAKSIESFPGKGEPARRSAQDPGSVT